jgi:hypothetical protein
MSSSDKKRPHADTLPLFGRGSSPPIAANPHRAEVAFAPTSSRLDELHDRPGVRISRPATANTPSSRQVRDSLPASSPEWMRVARTLSRALEHMIETGNASPLEQAALARMFASWNLGGMTENQVLQVAHLVSRAHRAIRDTLRQETEVAIGDCAGVLHSGLPSTLRARVPLERVRWIVRAMRQTADPWAALVEATSELVGWSDLARWHTAALLRCLLEGAALGRRND